MHGVQKNWNIGILAFAVSIVVPPVCAGDAQARDLPGPKGNPLWNRYFVAGEQSLAHNNPTMAKRYWLGALAGLEALNTPPPTDGFFNVRLATLEQKLLQLYPKDMSGIPDAKEREKIQSERTDVLRRIAAINSRLIRSEHLPPPAGQSQERQLASHLTPWR